MNIQLERPVIFFDLETTGTDFVKDRIIELYAKKINLDNTTSEIYYLLDPDVIIDADATAKHGYTAEMLKGNPKFNEVAEDIYIFFKGCDYGGYNSVKFDIPFLFGELKKYGFQLNEIYSANIVDPFKILYKKEPRTLEAYYETLFGEKFDNAHSAKSDIEATIRVFEYQIEKYGLTNIKEVSDISRQDKDGNQLLDFSGLFEKRADGKIYYGFGKNKGMEIYNDVQYLEWIYTKSNFDENVKVLAEVFYKRAKANQFTQ